MYSITYSDRKVYTNNRGFPTYRAGNICWWPATCPRIAPKLLLSLYSTKVQHVNSVTVDLLSNLVENGTFALREIKKFAATRETGE